ncbi:MAG: tape measure protein [Acetobacterium sp.]|uniref:tape measure protein n=1 Tax=Acetobacterium sp. TaxID=1872094 RepID=UPI0032421409
MSSISSSIRLSDQMSPAINSMLKGMNAMVSGFEHMNTASAGAFDMKSMAMARSEMAKAGAAMKQFEKSVEEAEKSQKEFNSTAKASTSSMGGLIGKVGALAAGYMSLQAIQGVMDMSDTYSQTTARLGLMNDGLQTTAELQTEIFNAANDSHASYQSMSDMVSKLGLMAGDAFSNNDEIVDFAEQVSKQFVISGASAGETSNAMLQLTQAMASGVLRGDELNSIFENSPTLIQTIADYLGVPIGEIRNMASEGEITADIIKNSMFKAANATDAKFEAMGMTFGQAWTIFQNKSNRAFQGVFTQMGQLANSDALDGFLDGLAGGVGMAASALTSIGSGIGAVFSIPEVQSLATDIGTGFSAASSMFKTNIDQITEKIKEKSPEMIQSVDHAKSSWTLFYDRITADNEALKGVDWQDGLVSAMDFEIDKISSMISMFTNLGTIMTNVQNMQTAFFKGPEAFKDAAIQFDQDLIRMSENIAKASGEAPDPSTMLASAMEANRGSVDAAAANMVSAVSTPLTELTTNATAAGNTIGLGVGSSVSTGMTTGFQVGFAALPYSSEQAGQQATAGFIAGALGNPTGIADAGKTSAQILIDATNSTLDVNSPSKVFQQTGNYVGDGLIQGLKDRERQIATGGDSAATALKDSFKKAMGINSPSTVFREFGYYAIDGLIEGLSDTEMMTFCESIVADMKAAFESGNFNLQAGVEYLGGGAAEFFKSIGIGGASLGQLITPLAGDVTSGFGYRPPEETNGIGSTYHEGIDIGAAAGTPIGAAGAGTVIFAGWNGGYGNMVEIDHGNGLTSLYAHMESIAASLGQTVSAGQTIGYVGSTGNSTGPHLHFGLYQDGQAIDPGALWGYSSGTMSARAGLHLVGENGPEIIGFGGGETVLNSKKTKNFTAFGNSTAGGSQKNVTYLTVQLTGDNIFSNDMDVNDVADKIGDIIVGKMNTRPSVAS